MHRNECNYQLKLIRYNQRFYVQQKHPQDCLFGFRRKERLNLDSFYCHLDSIVIEAIFEHEPHALVVWFFDYLIFNVNWIGHQSFNLWLVISEQLSSQTKQREVVDSTLSDTLLELKQEKNIFLINPFAKRGDAINFRLTGFLKDSSNPKLTQYIISIIRTLNLFMFYRLPDMHSLWGLHSYLTARTIELCVFRSNGKLFNIIIKAAHIFKRSFQSIDFNVYPQELSAFPG